MSFHSVLVPPSPASIPTIRFEGDANGNVQLYSEGPEGDGHFAALVFGGGHWELHLKKSLPGATGLEIGEDGYVVVHKD